MKTTSHLGGRKAHTAKGRRVRYETSTRVRRVRVVVRMTGTFLHAGPATSSAGAAPVARSGPAGTPDPGPPGTQGRHVRTSCAPSTTAK
jgi:hypothetical protein